MLLLRRSALSARAACARPAVGANRWAAPRAFSQVPEKNDSTETEYGGVATSWKEIGDRMAGVRRPPPP